jgi:hypothetical protein
MEESQMEIDNVPDRTAEDTEMLQVNVRAEFKSSSTLSRTVRKSCIFFIFNYDSLEAG